jgi:putative membrane protein
MLDLALAIIHHLLVFALFGVFAAELMIVRRDIGAAEIRRLAAVDAWYGTLAAAIIIAGFSRAIFAAKGWDYYSHNLFFWLKLGAFAGVGLLSVPPTLKILAWRRAQRVNAGFAPPPDEVRRIQGFLVTEAVLFAFIPAFAAAMARGYGSI